MKSVEQLLRDSIRDIVQQIQEQTKAYKEKTAEAEAMGAHIKTLEEQGRHYRKAIADLGMDAA